MADARKHPDFHKMNKILVGLGVSEYDKRCFHRWLAIAAAQGGWMSDYDTFPLNFDAEVGAKISQHGLFTSFDGHVPSLISAAKHEWERVAQLMLEFLQRKTKEDGLISDMVSSSTTSTSTRYKYLFQPSFFVNITNGIAHSSLRFWSRTDVTARN